MKLRKKSKETSVAICLKLTFSDYLVVFDVCFIYLTHFICEIKCIQVRWIYSNITMTLSMSEQIFPLNFLPCRLFCASVLHLQCILSIISKISVLFLFF